MVGGCGSQSGSNNAVSGWWEERENTGGRVRHGCEKLFNGFLTARVKRWNLGLAQSENVCHTPAASGKMLPAVERLNHADFQTIAVPASSDQETILLLRAWVAGGSV